MGRQDNKQIKREALLSKTETKERLDDIVLERDFKILKFIRSSKNKI